MEASCETTATPSSIEQKFTIDVESVYALMNFDHTVLELAITQVSDLQERLTKHHKFDNARLSVVRTLTLLQNIRNNNSLRPRYHVIFNQCVVLLVSYFGAAVGEVFRSLLPQALKSPSNEKVLKDEIRVSLGELQALDFNLFKDIGDLVVAKKDISFQDMQSIERAFRDYFGYAPRRSNDVNNIVLAQACRHAIVHAGAIADSRLVKQIAQARPRDVKDKIKEREHIQFELSEIEVIAKSMVRYIEDLLAGIRSSLAGKEWRYPTLKV